MLTPLELIERLAALIPPPRRHRHRYYGVLAPSALRIDFTQSFQCEGRSGAVAQQALQPLAVARFDPHAGIERKHSAVLPGAHCLGFLAFKQAPAGENARQTVAHLGLNLGDGCGTDAPGFMKAAGYVHPLWLAAYGAPVWGATIAPVVLAVLVFRYV